MESENLKNFISEAEIYLPMIRNAILLCSQEGNFGGELETALRYSQVIAESSASIGLDEIEKASLLLEAEIRQVIDIRDPLSDEQTRNLLDKLAQIEELFVTLQFSDEDFSLNFDGFVEESFSHLGFDSAETNLPAESETVEEDSLEGFEIDAEMLEIFAEEADDLLRNINSHLEILQSAPNNRESLLEIRRNAHTLKGSAGIVGLKPLSSLAHRVEDLLDYLSEKEIEANRMIFELLQTSSDCLSAIAAGENSPQLSKKIEAVYRNFADVLQTLENGTFDEEPTEIPVPEMPLPATENQAPANPKPVIRVAVEKLDEIVRLVGDLVISRSVFERRLTDFERQVNELQRSVNRLTRSTGKLETDFEANMLQAPNARFQRTNLNSSFHNQTSSNFDSLEFDRYTEFHQTTRELLETATDMSAVSMELDKIRGSLDLLFGNQSRLIEEMHDKMLHLRMIKFGSLASRLQRTMRVTCDEENKQAELFIEGEQTEVDSQILDLLVEPLLHLLRNAIAHGIESPDTRRLLGKPEKGKIHIKMQSEGTHVILSITDDGRGLSAIALREKAVRNGFISKEEAAQMSDEDAFSLGFLPGVSTAEEISQTAGRGVGMNIIKTSVQRGQGSIAISSEPQKGATFTIRMPMALAITRGLLVKSGGQNYAFPLKLVKKVGEVSAEELVNLGGADKIRIDDTDYKIANLGTLLNLPDLTFNKEMISLLLIESAEIPYALMVDEILRAEEIVIKPLPAPLQNYPQLIGASILGDGSIVPVLDLLDLLKNHSQKPSKLSKKTPVDAEQSIEPENPAIAEIQTLPLRVMIVDDSPSVRHITSKLIKNAGMEVILAKDGLEALETLQASDTLPDVVLTDVEMPRMDGYELLSAIRNQVTLQTIPVVMITSRASEKHQQKAVELGVSEYLTKPFDDSVLIEKINTLANC